MDVSRVYISGPSLRDLEVPTLSNCCLMADVVILDKTQDQEPLLYQLREDAAAEICSSPTHTASSLRASADQFLLIGSVLSIDRSKKMMYLSNENMLSYRYLIIIYGMETSHDSSDDFSAALHSLTEALKIKEHKLLPSSQQPNPRDMSDEPQYQVASSGASKELAKLLQTLSGPEGQESPMPLGSSPNKLVYEVHV